MTVTLRDNVGMAVALPSLFHNGAAVQLPHRQNVSLRVGKRLSIVSIAETRAVEKYPAMRGQKDCKVAILAPSWNRSF